MTDLTHTSARAAVLAARHAGAVLPESLAAALELTDRLAEPMRRATEDAAVDQGGLPYVVVRAQDEAAVLLREQAAAGQPVDEPGSPALALLRQARQRHQDAADLVRALVVAGAAYPTQPGAGSALSEALGRDSDDLAVALDHVLVDLVHRARQTVQQHEGAVPADDAAAYRAEPADRQAYEQLLELAQQHLRVRLAAAKLRALYLADTQHADVGVLAAAETADVGAHWPGAGSLVWDDTVAGVSRPYVAKPRPWPAPGTVAHLVWLAEHPDVRPWVPTFDQLQRALRVEEARRAEHNAAAQPTAQVDRSRDRVTML